MKLKKKSENFALFNDFFFIKFQLLYFFFANGKRKIKSELTDKWRNNEEDQGFDSYLQKVGLGDLICFHDLYSEENLSQISGNI